MLLMASGHLAVVPDLGDPNSLLFGHPRDALRDGPFEEVWLSFANGLNWRPDVLLWSFVGATQLLALKDSRRE